MADDSEPNGKKQKINPSWSESAVIAEKVNIQEQHVASVIDLLDGGATIPFIVRYRKEKTGDMPLEKIRETCSLLDELRQIKTKISSVFTAVCSQGKMSTQLERSLRCALTMEEVERLYAPFKPGHKGTLAERARALGLEPAALSVLEGKVVCLSNYMKPSEKGLASVSQVETGVQHIIADIIYKDEEVMVEVRKICSSSNVTIESKKAKKTTTSVNNKVEVAKEKKNVCKKEQSDTSHKFEQYFNFAALLTTIKPHQILAINRGEEQKVLTVKVIMPDSVKVRFMQFAQQKFIKNFFPSTSQTIIWKSLEDSFDRLIQPQICRHFRSEQTISAQKVSVTVFTENVRGLLLTPPVKGKTVLGIDPGFANGCKCAVVSPTGDVLETAVIFLHDYRSDKQSEQENIVCLVKAFKCNLIAIGNGVGCRETEKVVTSLIQSGSFDPIPTAYCIVDEGGASIYSVSDEAQQELPNLDPTLRGAVSIARRLQDPLSELVKLEPKHIGVGMYQHDISKIKLQTALDSVVQECVSFVGVDLNTASHCLLRHIAGLSAAKANNIIEWRQKHGMFQSRSQLLEVKAFGQRSFEQCAGFVRVLASYNQSTIKDGYKDEMVKVSQRTGQKRKAEDKVHGKSKKARLMKNKSADPNPLDMTAIHPESYSVASRLIADLGLSSNDIGQPAFLEKIQLTLLETKDMNKLGGKYGVGDMTIKFILEALSRPINYDIRNGFHTPVFKKGLSCITDLKHGVILTGQVMNVTSFGAFVDIGVGKSGLIHVTKMRPPLKQDQHLGFGDRVEVSVLSVDINKGRISLQLRNLLNGP